MVEDNELSEIITRYQSEILQGSNETNNSRKTNRRENDSGFNQTQPKANPFARPSKPIISDVKNEDNVQDPISSEESLKNKESTNPEDMTTDSSENESTTNNN